MQINAEGKQQDIVEAHSGNWAGPEQGSAFPIDK